MKTKEKLLNLISGDENFYKTFKMFKVLNMKQAVEKAKTLAKDGDFVLLSPACASYDLYENFEKRGEDFKKIVQNF